MLRQEVAVLRRIPGQGWPLGWQDHGLVTVRMLCLMLVRLTSGTHGQGHPPVGPGS